MALTPRQIVLADLPSGIATDAEVAAAIAGISTGGGIPSSRVVSGQTYTLVPEDKSRPIVFTSNTPVNCTVPASLGDSFNCTIIQAGNGVVTFVESGASIAHPLNHKRTGGPNTVCYLYFKALNSYVFAGSTAAPSFAGLYAEALEKSLLFFEAQRSGPLPADNRIPWRGNSTLTDGADVSMDLVGGYFDAGDHVKFGLPGAFAMTTLAWGGVDYKTGYTKAGLWTRFLECLKWGTDYLLKLDVRNGSNVVTQFVTQVGDGEDDHSVWQSIETYPNTIARPTLRASSGTPASDIAAESAAALAAAAMCFDESNPSYAATCREHATKYFEFADSFLGAWTHPDTNIFYPHNGSYLSELWWAALWLWRSTGQSSWLTKANSFATDSRYAARVTAGDLNAQFSLNWANKALGCQALLAALTPDSSGSARGTVGYIFDRWRDGGDAITRTPGKLSFLATFSLKHASMASFVGGYLSDRVSDFSGSYDEFAEEQIQYMLGNNPRNSSYVCGVGNNPPQQPHHRNASGKVGFVGPNSASDPGPNVYTINGALVAGPKTANDLTGWQDNRLDFNANEVALDINNGFQSSLARLCSIYL